MLFSFSLPYTIDSGGWMFFFYLSDFLCGFWNDIFMQLLHWYIIITRFLLAFALLVQIEIVETIFLYQVHRFLLSAFLKHTECSLTVLQYNKHIVWVCSWSSYRRTFLRVDLFLSTTTVMCKINMKTYFKIKFFAIIIQKI